MKGYLYILECSDTRYYAGSTIDVGQRFLQHQKGEGPNFTWKHLPVKLIYVESLDTIELTFHREKQIQGWSRKKKEALISGDLKILKRLSECQNDSSHKIYNDKKNHDV